MTRPRPAPLAEVLREQLDDLLRHHEGCPRARRFGVACSDCDRLARVSAALTAPFRETPFDVGIAHRPKARAA